MYYTYNWLKPHLCSRPDAPSLLEKLSAGGLAGCVALTCVYPLYVSQARLAIAGPGKYRNLLDFAVKTVQAEGISSFGRGYIPSVIRSFPSKGVEMAVYNTLKETFIHKDEQPSITQCLAFGAISAVTSQSLTQPLLCIRTKMMGQVIVTATFILDQAGCFRPIWLLTHVTPSNSCPSYRRLHWDDLFCIKI